MLKTLRITSLLVAVAALAVIVTLGILGMRGDKEIEAYLSKPSAVDMFRKGVKPDTAPADKISPLVTQAQKFTLRINPPKAKPRTAVTTRPTPSRTAPNRGEPVPTVSGPKIAVNAKFKLTATCRYEDDPERSLALLNITSKGNEWFRQGDKIGNLTIHEIKDGSIVLYQGDAENSLLEMVPGKTYIRSLLKGDEEANEAGRQTSLTPATTPVTPSIGSPRAATPVRSNVKTPTRVPTTRTPAVPARTVTPPVRRTTRRTTRPTTTRPAPKPVVRKPQTKEDLKESIDESISGIEDIMSRSKDGPGGDDESNKIWGDLLKSLKEDKEELDQP